MVLTSSLSGNWTLATATGDRPPGVSDSQTWVVGNVMYLYGGATNESYLSISSSAIVDGFYRLNLTSMNWTLIASGRARNYGSGSMQFSSSVWPGRIFRSGVAKDPQGRIWLIGGYSGNRGAVTNDLWVYDPSLGQWAFMDGCQTAGSCTNQVTSCPGLRGSCSPSGRLGPLVWQKNATGFYMSSGLTELYEGTDWHMWYFDFNNLQWSLISTSVLGNSGNAIAGGCYWPSPTQNRLYNLMGFTDRGTFIWDQEDFLVYYDFDSRIWVKQLDPVTNSSAMVGTLRVEGNSSAVWPSRRSSLICRLMPDQETLWLYGGRTCGYISSGANCASTPGTASHELWVFNITSFQFRRQDPGAGSFPSPTAVVGVRLFGSPSFSSIFAFGGLPHIDQDPAQNEVRFRLHAGLSLILLLRYGNTPSRLPSLV